MEKSEIRDKLESGGGPVFPRERGERFFDRLPEIWREFGVITLLDLPCGDFSWMSRVDLDGIDYLGGDTDPDLLEKNRRKYGGPDIRFQELDLLRGKLPAADMVFCRDALTRLSFADSGRAIRNLRASLGPATLLMASHFPSEKANTDLSAAGRRPLDLGTSPFNWPRPRYLLTEEDIGGEEHFNDESLGIWLLGDISDAGLPADYG